MCGVASGQLRCVVITPEFGRALEQVWGVDQCGVRKQTTLRALARSTRFGGGKRVAATPLNNRMLPCNHSFAEPLHGISQPSPRQLALPARSPSTLHGERLCRSVALNKEKDFPPRTIAGQRLATPPSRWTALCFEMRRPRSAFA